MNERSGSLISIRSYLKEEMRCKTNKGEETNPRQGGQSKGQDSNHNLPERRLCPTLLMNNIEKVHVLVERSLEKFK